MKPPRALLLDLDDTILAMGDPHGLWRAVCDEFAPRLPNGDGAPVCAAILERAAWYWSEAERHRWGRQNLKLARRQIVGSAFEAMGIAHSELSDEIADVFSHRREAELTPFPGALETLDRLRQRGLKMALVTNGSPVLQRPKIEKHDLARHFDAILIEGELGFGKPEEKVYRHALELLQVAPAETWMVGDNLEWEVAAPQRLGIVAVWVDWRGAGIPPGSDVKPNIIIRSIAELPALLRPDAAKAM
jgi:putative hydrolase of the HAD superfamily